MPVASGVMHSVYRRRGAQASQACRPAGANGLAARAPALYYRCMTDRSVAKESLLPALAETFRTHGYDGASLSALARATGLQKASLYHHFPGGKQEMAEAVLDEHARQFEDLIFTPLAGGEPLRQRIDRMLLVLDSEYDGGTAPSLFSLFAQGPKRDMFGARIAAFYGRWITSLSSALAENGLPRTEAVRRAADAVMVLEGALLLSRALSDTGPFQRVTRQLEEVLVAPAREAVPDMAQRRAVGTNR